ncbi:Cadherin-23 [Acipenser ruthenus]|uniref:Cadherin-23 n=1 Tax=Acipenser ruthenus TaxID=7906 RepID=A0A444U3N7_ACIRT|nr:Cadherin-23 [Acipenser ruthenus]
MAVRRCGLIRSLLLSVLLLLSVSPAMTFNRLPYFLNYFFDNFFLIYEDTPVGASVTQLLARDPDNDPLVFGVVGEEATRYFAVESSTGVVWLRQPLDREMKSEFQVEFSVSDNQGVIKGTVNIQVGDVNDNAPTFHSQPYSVRIPENTPVATPIFIVNATDPDQGTGGSVLFSFQPPSPFFAIDGARGVVTVIRLLDYETTQGYQLTVNATDQDKTRPLSTLVNLAITITDVQDMDPVFINLPYNTNIYENSPPGSTVRMITAIDQDRGKPRGIGYTIVSGNTNSIFALDYISGALTLNGQLDRENPLYSSGFLLTVRGTELNDDRTPSSAMVTTSFNILVIDVNDNAPQFNSSEYRLRITELAQVGFALPLFIQVQDLDEGPNSMFQVFLTGNNSDHFIISPTSVQGRADIRIRVAEPLDFERVSSYRFSLLANETASEHAGFARVQIDLINENDNRPIFTKSLYNASLFENTTVGTAVLQVLLLANETASEHAGFARVQIDLINENDNRPIFTKSLYNASLFENTTVGTAVLQVLATDGDFGTFGAVSYFFSDEPDKFSIDKDSGQVTLMGRLDFELAQRYTLTVIARDGGGEETTGRLRVNVLDVNDNTPTFQKEGYLGSVRENEPTTVQVTRLRATDDDSPPNNQITYTLTSATTFQSYFDISVIEGYGVISVTRPLNYELVPGGIIYLTVMAKDAGNPPLNSTVPVTIEVFDENDNPPTFSQPSYVITVPENIIAGATVLFVNATDLDASREFGQASLIYSLEGSSQFRLNTRSGEITTTSLLDREQKSEYILIVRAVDGGVGPTQKTGIATVNITLLDINDNPPAWRDEPYQVNVVEMSPIDTDVVTVLAVDPDRAENGSVVYSINPSNRFYISNSTSGTPPLYATASTTVQVNLLDLNDNDPAFQNLPFVAEVPEGLPIGSSVYQVSKMLDVNDETPTFIPSVYNVTLLESVPRDHTVTRLSCRDGDAGLNAELSYFITGGNQDGKFSVGFRDGVIQTVVSLDRETQASYTLIIEAIDNGPAGSRRTGTATVNIIVQDVNDNRPIFLQNSYETSVLETIPESTSIVQVPNQSQPL